MTATTAASPTATTGKNGVLVLKLARDEAVGGSRTVVKEMYSQVPLFAQKALYLEKSLPEMAYLYIMSPSGGMLQGDRYRLEISLEDRAKAHVTTQGATRVYRMENGGFAAQDVAISAGRGAYLEYMPDQIIPYAGSRLRQKTVLKVHEEATVVYSEIIVPGRTAMGESFQYDEVSLRVEAFGAGGGELKFADYALLEPKKRPLSRQGILAGEKSAGVVVGSVYALVPPQHLAELEGRIAALGSKEGVAFGCSVLPRGCGVSVRMIGRSAGGLRQTAYGVAAAVRKTVLGAQFSAMRKG